MAAQCRQLSAYVTASCNRNPEMREPSVLKWSFGPDYTWWRHQMETFSALLVLCEGNPPATDGFPWQRPVTLNFVVFFDLCLNKRSSKQSTCRWCETSSHSLWRYCNETCIIPTVLTRHNLVYTLFYINRWILKYVPATPIWRLPFTTWHHVANMLSLGLSTGVSLKPYEKQVKRTLRNITVEYFVYS